jgi:hypothetical protein
MSYQYQYGLTTSTLDKYSSIQSDVADMYIEDEDIKEDEDFIDLPELSIEDELLIDSYAMREEF